MTIQDDTWKKYINMTENFGNEIWKNVLSEKRLNNVIVWHKERSDL